MKTCKEYRDTAWNTLSSHWNDAVVITLIMVVCACIGSGVGLWGTLAQLDALSKFGTGTNFVVSILLVMPLGFAFAALLLGYVRQEQKEEGALRIWLHAFLDNYTNYVVTGFLMYVVMVAIGIVTLGIGAIIFGFAYAMVPYLLKDHPEMGAKEILHTSRMMMRGHKWDLFVLVFSFIGWWLLCIVTCGIALLWVGPYMNAAQAHFYEDLINQQAVDMPQATNDAPQTAPEVPQTAPKVPQE